MRSMTDRRNCGAIRSSNCFQTSAAFVFLFFMGRSRKEVDSRQLTVHRQEKGQRLNTESPEATEKKEVDVPDRVGIFDQKLKAERKKRN